MVGNDVVRKAMALPVWKPALVEMAPAAETPGGEASFYLDRTPTSLRAGRVGLYRAQTGGTRKEYTRGALLPALAGRATCADLLSETVGPDERLGYLVPDDAGGTYLLRVDLASGRRQTYGLTVEVVVCEDDGHEPNDTAEQATALRAVTTCCGCASWTRRASRPTASPKLPRDSR